MPRAAEPLKPQLKPGETYIFQDYLGTQVFFDDGTSVELYGCADGCSLLYSHLAPDYERASHVLRMEDIKSEPYEYTPGSSRVVWTLDEPTN
jgi:hypothetical protein